MIVDLIIPAFEEEANIPALFDALDQLPEGLVRRIIVADNGSQDATAELAAARDAIVVHEEKRGYGSACLKAIDWIHRQEKSPDVVVFLDADLSDDPAGLPALLAPLNRDNVKLVIGSRGRHADSGALNVVQRFGNRLACGLMRLLGGRRYTDLGPFRAIRWETLLGLNMHDRTWGWTVEMQMKAALLEVPFAEVDVNYRRRHSGKSKISGTLRGVSAAGWKIIFTIVVLWWNRRRIREASVAPRASA